MQISLKPIFKFVTVLSLVVAGFMSTASASTEHGHAEEKKGVDVAHIIFGHIGDSHYWHLFDYNDHPVSLSLPVIIYHPVKGLEMFCASHFHHGHESYKGYHLEQKGSKEEIVSADGADIVDLSITKNVVSMLLSVILLLWLMFSVVKRYKKHGANSAPKGWQNFIEMVIVFIRDEVAKPNIGPKKYKRFLPLLLTIFFFIWINNMLGLLPGGANLTGNIAFTACLAIITFIVMIVSGNKHFWGHLLNPPGVPTFVKFILVPIELISLFIKPIALMIRLFANIMAGHIIILCIISMIFIFGAISQVAGWGFMPVSIAFTIFMFCMELLVSAIQAFIFTNLSAVFIGQCVEEGHHEEAHGSEQAHH